MSLSLFSKDLVIFSLTELFCSKLLNLASNNFNLTLIVAYLNDNSSCTVCFLSLLTCIITSGSFNIISLLSSLFIILFNCVSSFYTFWTSYVFSSLFTFPLFSSTVFRLYSITELQHSWRIWLASVSHGWFYALTRVKIPASLSVALFTFPLSTLHLIAFHYLHQTFYFVAFLEYLTLCHSNLLQHTLSLVQLYVLHYITSISILNRWWFLCFPFLNFIFFISYLLLLYLYLLQLLLHRFLDYFLFFNESLQPLIL